MHRPRTTLAFCVTICSVGWLATDPGLAQSKPEAPGQTGLDLRVPMALAAKAIPPRLDASQHYRPFFLIRGKGGVPAELVHDTWDLGDMTGRYLEGLILARRMGITAPDLSAAEERLAAYLRSLIGPDGTIQNIDAGKPDHPFSQGSALYGLLAWFEATSDPAPRRMAERIICGLLARAESHGDQLRLADARVPESSGSHLAGYIIWPTIRLYELTGNPEALKLASGLARWALADEVIAAGTIGKPLSWEGHIHSWLDTLAGCARTARVAEWPDRDAAVARCRSVYDWVRRTNSTDFGWVATYPTGGSCETCAISSAIRLALELDACGHHGYLDDVERFVRNQVVEAQFRDLDALAKDGVKPTPMLLGVFDSQSMPNGHLGTRGGEDVGNVEGCCLNGGMRAIYLPWAAAVSERDGDVYVHLAITRASPYCEVLSHDPQEGRIDVKLRCPAARVLVRLPDWSQRDAVRAELAGKTVAFTWEGQYAAVSGAKPSQTITLTYPLREKTEDVTAGKERFRITWRGNTVVHVDPPGKCDQLYNEAWRRTETSKSRKVEKSKQDSDGINKPRAQSEGMNKPRARSEGIDGEDATTSLSNVPDTYLLQDAAVAAAGNILVRLDPARRYQPFFRVYPFADPPYAVHEKWDDGDMTGRYVSALAHIREMTGLPMDPRERQLRRYLASLFDPKDGLCYTQPAAWVPRRACMFSQSCAMLGLLAWYDETGSPEARALLDRHADGLARLAVRGRTPAKDGTGRELPYAYYPKYEWDGAGWVEEPKGKDAPAWYGGRNLLPLVEYWKRFPRPEIAEFIEQLARYCVDVNTSVHADGSIGGGEGWWGHLHGSMDMAAGVAEYGRLAGRPEWVAWARRMYEWIGRTQTSRFGWTADVVGSPICESCGIMARFNLALALYRAGAADPFGEMDRFARNQLLANQFKDAAFMKAGIAATHPASMPGPDKPGEKRFDKVDRMVVGCFQCWGGTNDLIGYPEVEGCGAGGGAEAVYLAWRNAVEWKGDELYVHLLFNRRVPAGGPGWGQSSKPSDDAHLPPPQREGGLGWGPPGGDAPIALEIWSHLPYRGRVDLHAHRDLKLRLRLPDGSEPESAAVIRSASADVGPASSRSVEGTAKPEPLPVKNGYAALQLAAGERTTVTFALKTFETDELAGGKTYRIKWKGSTVLDQRPRGEKVPLYADRAAYKSKDAPLCPAIYP